MNTNFLEFALSSMRVTYMNRLQHHVNNNNIGNSDAIFNEFIVNNVDPEESEYQWLFLEDLNDLSHLF